MKTIDLSCVFVVQSKGGYMEGMSGSEEEGEHDAYMERMKAEGKERDVDDDGGDDDDDDSTGESYTWINPLKSHR